MALVAALGLALASEGWASASSRHSREDGGDAQRVWLIAGVGVCAPGFIEQALNDWLQSTENSDFESEYVAIAFDELVNLVHRLRDVAEDFCV